MNLTISRWADPVLEAAGMPVTSRYVEVFWLPVLGPSAIWMLRHCSYHTADGDYTVDTDTLAVRLGIGRGCGNHSPVIRTLRRLVDFGCGHHAGTRWAVATHLPQLPGRHLRRLPEPVQLAHEHLLGTAVAS